MRHTFGALALLVLCTGATRAADFSPTPQPVSPDGTRAVCDLPASQHMRNTGGSDGPRGPGSGSGLCVFTSAEHTARWHNLPELDGFQRWMTRRPGGGWPQKLDDMLAQFCREKGTKVPAYIQHTGGDDTFLDLALKTDRLVCVTYAGADDFYRGPIAHMVNLAHIDGTRAAIIDNNRPGVWVWMSRADFLRRWRAQGGGWAVAFLNPPPPPHPEGQAFGAGRACVCGTSCTCNPGECPAKCPVVFGQNCANGRCQIPASPIAPSVPPAANTARSASPIYDGPEPPGSPPSDRHEWRPFEGGGYGWRLKEPTAPAAAENYGLDSSKIHAGRRYTVAGGAEIDRDRAHAMLVGDGLIDDSDRWHLTAVGDPAFLARVRADVEALGPAVRAKLLFQSYAPDHWAVALYRLPTGVSLRKPSPGRVSADVGAVPVVEYRGAASLAGLLTLPDGPTPAPPAPKVPDPVPPGPVVPAPKQPDPAVPAPQPTPPSNWWALIVAGAALVVAVLRRRA